MGWAIKVGEKAVDVASGADKTAGIVAAESSSVKKRSGWGGGELRTRVTRQGGGWTVDGSSPYGSYANTPMSTNFAPSPTLSTHSASNSLSGFTGYAPNGATNGGAGYGLGLHAGGHGLNGTMTPPMATAATAGSPYVGHSSFPTPNPQYSPATQPGGSFPSSPAPGSPAAFASPQLAPPKKDPSKKAD